MLLRILITANVAISLGFLGGASFSIYSWAILENHEHGGYAQVSLLFCIVFSLLFGVSAFALKKKSKYKWQIQAIPFILYTAILSIFLASGL